MICLYLDVLIFELNIVYTKDFQESPPFLINFSSLCDPKPVKEIGPLQT